MTDKKLREQDEEIRAEKAAQRAKIIRKIALILLCAVCLCALYTAAAFISKAVMSAQNPLGDSLRQTASELIEKSREVNEIIWGEGIPVSDDTERLETVSGTQYRICDTSYYIYADVTELKDYCASVYSYEIISSAFEDNEEGDGLGTTARYTDLSYVDDDGKKLTALACNIDSPAFSVNKNELDCESIKFVSCDYEWSGLWWKLDHVTFSLEETYEGNKATRHLTLAKNDDGKWVLDTATY